MRPLTHLISRFPGGLGLALMVIFGLAVLFRLADLGGRNLWTDEAWVALAALQPTPGEVLAAGKSTPPLYLLTLWAAAKLWGGSEAVLRSLSLCFGLGTVLLFWPLSRALVSLPASLLGLAMVAVSPVMVYYGKELKQYSGDAFFAVLVFLLVERLRTRPEGRAWPVLAVAGLLGLGFSHALIFSLPVAGAVLWFTLPATRRPRLMLLGTLWTLAFAVYYLLFYRHQVDQNLVAYWAQNFPDFSGLRPFLLWLAASWSRYLKYFLGDWGVVWGLPMLLAGGWVLGRQGSTRALFYLGGPLFLALGAAALHRYPFMPNYLGNRLMLFSAPLLYLLVATGLASSLIWLGQRRQYWLAASLAGLILLAVNPLEIVQENLHPSSIREEVHPLINHLETQLQPEDRVYVYYHAISPFKYYFHGPAEGICWGETCVETGLDLQAKGAGAPRRLWLVGSHIPSLEYMRQFAAGLLGPHWQETSCLTRKGAVLFSFERSGPRVASKTRPIRPAPRLSGSPAPPPDKAYK